MEFQPTSTFTINPPTEDAVRISPVLSHDFDNTVPSIQVTDHWDKPIFDRIWIGFNGMKTTFRARMYTLFVILFPAIMTDPTTLYKRREGMMATRTGTVTKRNG